MKIEEEILEGLEKGYWPDWDASLKPVELKNLFANVMRMPVGSKKYYQIKAELMRNIGRNGIEQYERGKDCSGMETRILFDIIDHYFLRREIEGGIR